MQDFQSSEQAQATIQKLGRQMHLHTSMFDTVNKPLLRIEQMAKQVKAAVDQVCHPSPSLTSF